MKLQIIFLLFQLVLLVKGDKYDLDEDTVVIDSNDRSKRQILYQTYPIYQSIPIIYYSYPQQPVPVQYSSVNSSQSEEIKLEVAICMTSNGEEGVCTTFKQCYPFHYASEDFDAEVFKNNELAQMLKNASGPCPSTNSLKMKNKICCSWMREKKSGNFRKPSDTLNPSATRRPPLSQGPNQRQRPPVASRPSTPQAVGSSCGKTQIVGGYPTGKGKYPWMVALMNNGRQFCGGSLIDSMHVLTAAHCVSHMGSGDVQRLRLNLGDDNLYSTYDGPHVVKRASKVFYNRGFSFRTLYNDIAIIRLDSPVSSNRPNLKISPICIPQSYSRTSSTDNLQGTVVGWGQTGARYSQSKVLRAVTIRIWPNYQCQNKYGNKSPAGIQDHMLCAGNPNRDSCRGDSGGPISIIKGGLHQQVGIVSWGIDCGDPPSYFPGVFTRVDQFLPWINKNRRI